MRYVNCGAGTSRRRFLAVVLGSVAAWLTPPRAGWSAAAWLGEELDRLAGRIPGAAALGQRYLAAQPEEASAALLADALFAPALEMPTRASGRRGMRECIAAGCAADYRAGRLVVIDGWVLTKTEARLLALLSLRRA